MITLRVSLRKWVSWIVLGLFVVWSLFPLFWTVLTSFKTIGQVYAVPPLIVFPPTLDNWDYVIRYTEFPRFYLNTLIIAGLSTLLSMTLGLFIAYALARFDIKRKDDIAFFILSQRIIPPATLVIPFYVLFITLGIMDTYWALILPYSVVNLAFSTWILRSLIEEIPSELDDSALLDGASILDVLREIIVPQISIGFVATAVFIFALSSNEYFLASLLTGYRARPVSVAVTMFLPVGVRGAMPGPASVASILMLLPSMMLFTFFQRYIVRGLTFGIVRR